LTRRLAGDDAVFHSAFFCLITSGLYSSAEAKKIFLRHEKEHLKVFGKIQVIDFQQGVFLVNLVKVLLKSGGQATDRQRSDAFGRIETSRDALRQVRRDAPNVSQVFAQVLFFSPDPA
jgi:hypothetical protein